MFEYVPPSKIDFKTGFSHSIGQFFCILLCHSVIMLTKIYAPILLHVKQFGMEIHFYSITYIIVFDKIKNSLRIAD